MAPMGWIKTVGVSEMNYNMFLARCKNGSDRYMARCRVGFGWERKLMVVISICVEAQIYKFVYSKKCSEPRGPS